jgi:hypothetical protein
MNGIDIFNPDPSQYRLPPPPATSSVDLFNRDPSQYSLGNSQAMTAADRQISQMNEHLWHPQNEDDYHLIPAGAYFVDPEDYQIYQKEPEESPPPQQQQQQQQQQRGILV